METVPKLLPTWHDITLQDCIRQKRGFKYSSVNPPDYGGIGLDVNINAKVHCRIPKYTKCQIRFAANKCALPFVPLRKIAKLIDPCLEDLKKEKIEFNKFSMSLTYSRDHVSKKKLPNLKALHHKIYTYCTENQNEELSIRVPRSYVHLADTIPKRILVPTFNVAYAGGTLAACKSSSKQNFLHPSGENLSQLCITPLLDGNDQHFSPNFSEQMIVNLEEEPVLQIEPTLYGFCCVRQKNSFHLVDTTNRDIYSKPIHKSGLYHIASSPYNPMEVLSVYDKGVMKLRNMETRKTPWYVSSKKYEDSFNLYPTWRCSFGSHPFSAFSLNEKNLYSFDFREKRSTAREIFTIGNSSFYVGEELFGMKQWNKNPFQHFLTSNHHLIVCDERYPKLPVIYWNHCLKDPPLYIECADFDSNVSIIVIGNQGTQQLASFLCSHQAEIQPVSLSTPLLLSSPSDCIKSLKLHCHYVDDKISRRLSCPLTGLCIFPSNKELGFTVLQSTSLGDIFYQDFKQSSEDTERTYHVSTGCVLTPPEKILPYLSKLNLSSDTVEKSRDTDETISRVQINIDKILSPPREISINCMFCRSSSGPLKTLVSSEICPTCTLSSAESEHFSKASANDSVIIGPASTESNFLDCDLDYLSKFDDTYSKKMLSVWLESDNVEESQVSNGQNESSLS